MLENATGESYSRCNGISNKRPILGSYSYVEIVSHFSYLHYQNFQRRNSDYLPIFFSGLNFIKSFINNFWRYIYHTSIVDFRILEKRKNVTMTYLENECRVVSLLILYFETISCRIFFNNKKQLSTVGY